MLITLSAFLLKYNLTRSHYMTILFNNKVKIYIFKL